MRKNRLFIEWSVLLLATLGLVLGAWQQQWTHRLDAAWLDFSSWLLPNEASNDIVIVAIDDRTLAEVGNWPWDRSKHADLVDKLALNDPALIVIDVLFLDPIAEQGDQEFADAISKAGNVLLPYTFGPTPGTVGELQPIYPDQRFRSEAAATGHVAVLPDPDGVVRRFELDFKANGQTYSHLAKEAFLASGGSEGDLSGEIVPMLPTGSFRTISAADLNAHRISKDFISGKLVLIGSTAQGLGDRYAVSAYSGRIMPGVEIQANLLNGMLQGQLINEAPKWLVAAILVLPILLLFLCFWRVSPNRALAVSLVLIAGLIVLSLASVIVLRQAIPVFSAVVGILLAYPVWGWRRLSAVSRFLEGEANTLTDLVHLPDSGSEMGFDTIARQVSAVRGLIGETRERLSFLRQTFAASPDAILVFNAAGGLVMLNQRAEALFGNEGENEGQTFTQLIAKINANLASSSEELVLPDERTFLVATSQVRMLEGHKVISLRDISTLRENERQRREALEFLSHDMRSPQAAIVGLTGSAGQALDLPERMKRIGNLAHRTLKLADNFVQIARLEHDGIEPQDCDLCAQILEAIDRAYAAASRKSISIQSSIPTEPEFCLVEPSSMARAIDNLLDNAIKFSPEGGQVRLSLERTADNHLTIEVEDFGPGLSEERINNTFARFGSRQSNAGVSAGLGLAYVKQVIDEHGGEISVRSATGEGTCFKVILNAEQSGQS